MTNNVQTAARCLHLATAVAHYIATSLAASQEDTKGDNE